MDEMTTLSQAQLERALRIKTPGEAAAALLQYPHYRTLGDVLHSFFHDNGSIKKTLVEGLLLWEPDSSKDALEQKVSNWLSGKRKALTKEEAFILSHILGLTLHRANDFLKMSAGEGIHWRDPEDIVWSYTIHRQLDPAQTRSLLAQARALIRSLPEPSSPAPLSYTAEVYSKVEAVLFGTEEELLAFLRSEGHTLGSFHNTAHRRFTEYMQLLEQGFSNSDVEAAFREMNQNVRQRFQAHPELAGYTAMYQPDHFTAVDILETYLYRSLVPKRMTRSEHKDDPFFAIRKCIRESWPSETTLSLMRNRSEEIPRKVLILLFLATDEGGDDPDGDSYTAGERFLDVKRRMELMLHACGFPKLDPRNAFDWMILFCISSSDLWEQDERLQAMLCKMFSFNP